MHRTITLHGTLSLVVALFALPALAAPVWTTGPAKEGPATFTFDLAAKGATETIEVRVVEEEPSYQPSASKLVDAWLVREFVRVRGTEREPVLRVLIGTRRGRDTNVLPMAAIDAVLEFDGDGRNDLVYWQGDEDSHDVLLVMQEADGSFTAHDFGSADGSFPRPSFVKGQARVLPMGSDGDELKKMGYGDVAIDWDAKVRRFVARGLWYVRGDHVQVRAKPVDGAALLHAFSGDWLIDRGAGGAPDWVAVTSTGGGEAGVVHKSFLSREVRSWSSKVKGKGTLEPALRPLGPSWVADFDGDGIEDRVRLCAVKGKIVKATTQNVKPALPLPAAPLALVYDFADRRVAVVGIEATGLMLPPIPRRAIERSVDSAALVLHTEASIDVQLRCPKGQCRVEEPNEEP